MCYTFITTIVVDLAILCSRRLHRQITTQSGSSSIEQQISSPARLQVELPIIALELLSWNLSKFLTGRTMRAMEDKIPMPRINPAGVGYYTE